MRRKSLVFGILALFILTFDGFTNSALAATGTCTTISGSYSGSVTKVTSPSFPVAAGDRVYASNFGTQQTITGVGVIIVVNGHESPFVSAGYAASGEVDVATAGTAHVVFINNAGPGGLNWSVSYGATCGQNGISFTDGRVNSHDGAESAAIYCEADHSVTVWAVINSQGYFAFHASLTDIAKVPVNPAKNTLIKQAMNIALYRLTTGELQVNAPGNYVFIWSGCPPA